MANKQVGIKTLVLIILALNISIISGCINIKYTGKNYPPTDKVDFFNSRKDIPKKLKYHIMGKAIATAPSNKFSRDEIEDKLVAKAESEGANAVVIVSFIKVRDGSVREDQLNNDSPADDSWTPDDDSTDDWRHQEEFLDLDTGPNKSTLKATYQTRIKALFLKYDNQEQAPSKTATEKSKTK
jgi:hypothetical protein